LPTTPDTIIRLAFYWQWWKCAERRFGKRFSSGVASGKSFEKHSVPTFEVSYNI